ncbi:MAG: hypothetical protein UY77_C0013G0008 [Candidatus Uhrbacteria bacterium GW2011_GWA2_53_10]|uniref:Uncharacterized protein n=1 Tax=Candidatus Uhrbacteria bacterium GW2011_GWA2_53_10 TaxID=1618980 RepID=A0A0G1XPJ9_9BACT|nr:MAG: hypothetical protein UY77_C0013G0008 [Candidatus Uhrbacteria bacterium GW2011_GWA2_53_10]
MRIFTKKEISELEFRPFDYFSLRQAEKVGVGPMLPVVPHGHDRQAVVYKDDEGTLFYTALSVPTHCSG